MSELCDAKEVAGRLRVTPETVLAWARRGWIPCLRAGRRPVLFDLEEVTEALRRRRPGPGSPRGRDEREEGG